MPVNVSGLSMLTSLRFDQGSAVQLKQDIVKSFEEAGRVSKESWKVLEEHLKTMAQRADPGKALVLNLEKALQTVSKSSSLATLEKQLANLSRLEAQFSSRGDERFRSIAAAGVTQTEKILSNSGSNAGSMGVLFGSAEGSIRAFQRALDDCKSSAILTGLEMQRAAAVQQQTAQVVAAEQRVATAQTAQASRSSSTYFEQQANEYQLRYAEQQRRDSARAENSLTADSARRRIDNSRPGGRAFYHTNRAEYNAIQRDIRALEADPTNEDVRTRLTGRLDSIDNAKVGRIWRNVHSSADNPYNEQIREARVNSQIQEELRTKGERIRGHEQMFNAAAYDQAATDRVSGEAIRRSAERHARRDPVNPDAVGERRYHREREEAIDEARQQKFQDKYYSDMRNRVDKHETTFDKEYARKDSINAARRQRVEKNADFYTNARTTREYELRQSASMADQMADGMDLKMNPKRDRPGHHVGHNLRFASQNLGFGIDDAIQSYHYGGIGASIRAASNNMTAIAGMTIPHPGIAAATVVGLSIGTAILPSILKRYGIDNQDLVRASAIRYSDTGTAGGEIRRNSVSVSVIQSKIKTMLDIADQNLQAGENRGMAINELQKHWRGDPSRIPIGYSTMLLSGDAKIKFDAAQAFLAEDESKTAERQSNYSLAKKQFDRLLGVNFDDQERGRQIETSAERRLYRATNLSQYNEGLKANHTDRLAHITATIKDEHTRDLMIDEEKYKLKDSLSRTEENTMTVEKNERERRYYLEDQRRANMGQASQFQGFKDTDKDYRRKIEGYSLDRSFTLAEQQALIASVMPGSKDNTYRRDLAIFDQVRANYGNYNPLRQMGLENERRQHEYMRDTSLSPDEKIKLVNASSAGFQRNRAEMFFGMEKEHAVNNPIGALQNSFIQETFKLRSMIADGGFTKEESDTLTRNLKRDYAVKLRQANRPSGFERFTADAQVVGGAADREMQMRMMGNFGGPEHMDAFETKSLEQFGAMLEQLSDLNAKLEVARLGL